MKYFLIPLMFFFTITAYAQDLKYQGGNVGFNKGQINQEVLLELIQQKQQEVKKDVFFNLVVGDFNKLWKDKSNLHNFATYYYIYNVFDEITSGKSKRAMTRSLVKRSLDFSYVYAFAFYCYQDLDLNAKIRGDVYAKKLGSTSSLDAKDVFASPNVSLKKPSNKATRISGWNQTNDQAFSDYLDVAFQILVMENANSNYQFEEDASDPDFEHWYQKHSRYVTEINKGGADKARMNALHQEMTTLFTGFDANVSAVESFLGVFEGITYDRIKDQTISKEELEAIKFVLNWFSKRAQSRYENNVVSVLIDMLTENIFYEDLTGTENDYVYLDAEAVISRVYSEFEKIAETKSFFRYITPVLDIGVNYAYLAPGNALATDPDNRALYYVSEKIGIRYKIWNWKYTHSQKAGKPYSYYNRSKVWNVQPKRASVSDIHFSTYFSGFLYQIDELKTDRSFDYFVWGNSVGLTFFNSLVMHAGMAVPINNGGFQSKNIMLNAGFDLPITEYITALTKKKQLK